MSDRFNIKQGNRLPTLRVQCLDGDGVPVDLTTATAPVSYTHLTLPTILRV